MKARQHIQTLLITGLLWFMKLLRMLPQPDPRTPARVNKILIIGYAAIGDLLFLLPALRLLKKHHPQAHLTFIADPYRTTQEIMPASGLTNEIWMFDWESPQAWLEQRAINRRIHDAKFDLVFLSLSAPAHFFQWGLRNIPYRVGHTCDITNNLPKFSWFRDVFKGLKWALVTGEAARRILCNRTLRVLPQPEHAVVRNLKLLGSLNIAMDASDGTRPPKIPLDGRHRDFAQKALQPLDSSMIRVGLHLGTPNNPYYKNWSHEKFAQLCRLLSQRRPVQFFCVGATQDIPIVEKVKTLVPGLLSWAGECSLFETYALIERCDLFINSDSGLAVAAMALGIPTTTIWGPADPKEFGPVWDPDKHLVIRTGIYCSPCARLGMAKQGPGIINYRTCGHHNCLNQLTPEQVFDAITRKYSKILAYHGGATR